MKTHLFAAVVLIASLGVARTDLLPTAIQMDKTAKVLADMHKTNVIEIEIGKMAQDRAQATGVKQYAEMLVTDHSANDDQVANLANQLSVMLPDKSEALTGKDRREISNLSEKSGTEFDRAFVTSMVVDHRKAIANLEAAKKDAPAQLALLIDQTLPTLQQHKTRAEQLKRQLSTNTPS